MIGVCIIGIWRSLSRNNIYDSSAAECANDLYSDSVLDLATVCCFLALHEMRSFPRKTHSPDVDRWSSGLPAQLASEKQVRVSVDDFVNMIPWLMVPLTYRSILFTAVQWSVVVLCINWQTWLTAKAISGLVQVRYWRAPTALRYSDGSESGSPSRILNLLPLTTGDEQGFAPSILYFLSRSSIFCLGKE